MVDGFNPPAELRFSGPAYRDHGLDQAALYETARFLELFEAVAEHLWREAFPGAGEPPADYRERMRLVADRIEPGSARVPFRRVASAGANQSRMKMPMDGGPEPEISDGLDLFWEVYGGGIREAGELVGLPASLLSKLAQFGARLDDESSCDLAVGSGKSVVIDQEARSRLGKVAATTVDHEVELTGRVIRADVVKGTFVLEASGDGRLEAPLSHLHEPVILTALRDHQETRVRLRCIGRYRVSGRLERIMSVEQAVLITPVDMAKRERPRPVSEVMDELRSHLTQSEWAKLPRDLSEHFDDYLLGEREWPEKSL